MISVEEELLDLKEQLNRNKSGIHPVIIDMEKELAEEQALDTHKAARREKGLSLSAHIRVLRMIKTKMNKTRLLKNRSL